MLTTNLTNGDLYGSAENSPTNLSHQENRGNKKSSPKANPIQGMLKYTASEVRMVSFGTSGGMPALNLTFSSYLQPLSQIPLGADKYVKINPYKTVLEGWAKTPLRQMLPRAASFGGPMAVVLFAMIEIPTNIDAVKMGTRTVGEAVIDGTVDIGIGVTSANAGWVLGAKFGGRVGTVLPGVGRLVAVVAGAAIGAGISYLLTEGKEYAIA